MGVSATFLVENQTKTIFYSKSNPVNVSVTKIVIEYVFACVYGNSFRKEERGKEFDTAYDYRFSDTHSRIHTFTSFITMDLHHLVHTAFSKYIFLPERFVALGSNRKPLGP